METCRSGLTYLLAKEAGVTASRVRISPSPPTMKILTWNIGSFSFLKYAKLFGFKYKDQKILHEYFQHIINGGFVSKAIEEINPDILFLQEIYDINDPKYIEILKNYPYQKLVDTWYHAHSILIASKHEFITNEVDNFFVVFCNGINFIPVHLNSFYAEKRLADAFILNNITSGLQNVVILGDTNIWSRGNKFLFKNDRKAYKVFCQNLVDFSKDIISTSYIGFGLDKIFGSKNLKILNIGSPKIRSVFMDHYPITVDLEVS